MHCFGVFCYHLGIVSNSNVLLQTGLNIKRHFIITYMLFLL